VTAPVTTDAPPSTPSDTTSDASSDTTSDTPLAALARAIRRAPATGQESERCDVCGDVLPDEHRHMLDGREGELRCTCRPCALLFHRDTAAQGRYRLVPSRRRRLPEARAALPELGLSVGLAFVVVHGDGTAMAHYPSPAGATRWELDAEAWHRAGRACPPLAALEPEVEALLVDTARGRREHWIVPIDDCYRLVAVIRREWRGLSGGAGVWTAIADFFADLEERSEHHG
jgi:hypothetical protein